MAGKVIQVNAIGDTCPIPIVKAKNAIKELAGMGTVEVLVDNEIAVQNLTKMAGQKGYAVKTERLEGIGFQVTMEISDEGVLDEETLEEEADEGENCVSCRQTIPKKNTVIVISSSQMGEGNEELGEVLMKGFIYAISQQEELPAAILFYNGGAVLTCEESPAIEDLKVLEAEGVEILTCGTCLNYYGMTEKLKVGTVTNMYTIAEKMTQADSVVKP